MYSEKFWRLNLKIGQKVKAQPIATQLENGQVIRDYVPEFLDRDTVYHVSHVKKNGWGTLLKLDKFQEWVNEKWFYKMI